MQTLATLIDGLDARMRRGAADAIITNVVDDSRAVESGCLFIARPGARHDGIGFAEDAVARNCAAILCGPGSEVAIDHLDVAIVVAEDPGSCGAAIAERFHGTPSRAIPIVGVTGTNGKTTIAWILRHIMDHAGVRCGMLGTVLRHDGQEAHAARLTTPGFCEASRHLSQMVANGCNAAVMECSSHALDQGRVSAIAFEVGIFTNLSGDHMDYHGSIDSYLRAKMRLFDQVGGLCVINMDDPLSWRVADRATAPICSCRLESDAAGAWVEVLEESLEGSNLAVHGPWGTIVMELPLLGRHNAINALQAAVAAHHLGIDAAAIGDALACATPPPGRLERVGDLQPRVLVDFAHTDDALRQVLTSLRPVLPTGGRLVVVFGCGGDRDRQKRPRMGRVASTLGDRIYATSDNPRSELPEAILDQVLSGVPRDCLSRVHRIADRRLAIEQAIGEADPADVVVIAGKGHERTQIIGAETIDFDDADVARDALAARSR